MEIQITAFEAQKRGKHLIEMGEIANNIWDDILNKLEPYNNNDKSLILSTIQTGILIKLVKCRFEFETSGKQE